MDLMAIRRGLMMQQGGGFNYLDPKTWFVAYSGGCVRSPEISVGGTPSTIERVGNAVVLDRSNAERGLDFLIGQLKAGETYILSGTFTNTGGKIYLCSTSNMAQDGNSFDYAVVSTISIVNNSVTLNPQQTGIYNILLWNNGSNDISAENVTLTAN